MGDQNVKLRVMGEMCLFAVVLSPSGQLSLSAFMCSRNLIKSILPHDKQITFMWLKFGAAYGTWADLGIRFAREF